VDVEICVSKNQVWVDVVSAEPNFQGSKECMESSILLQGSSGHADFADEDSAAASVSGALHGPLFQLARFNPASKL
jgi:hypothetical protein